MQFVRTDKNEPVDGVAPPDVWVWYGLTSDHCGDYPIHVIQATRGEYYVNVFWDERRTPCGGCDQRAASIDLIRLYIKDWE